nr:Rab family GTPase [Candidatus Sigynarchaeota archaeon]
MKPDIISGIVFAKYDDKIGPDAVSWMPSDLDENIRSQVSIKSLNLFAGDEDTLPKSLELIPFPSIELKGLIKCFHLKPKEPRTGLIHATITLIFSEQNDAVFYKYLNNFNPVFDEGATTIQSMEDNTAPPEEYSKYMETLHGKVMGLLEELYLTEMPSHSSVAFPAPVAEEKMAHHFSFKVIVVGDSQVGKTSTILRYTDNSFRKTYIMSMGVNITNKIIYVDDAKIEFVLWDIAGQSKFDKTRRSFYSGASGQLIVFDLTRPQTFHSVAKWYSDIQQALKRNVPGFILGNKSDLTESIAVNHFDITQLALKLSMGYFETSALTGKNVDEVFTGLVKLLRESKNEQTLT